MVSQITSIMIYGIAAVVAILGLLSFFALRRIKKNGKKNFVEHEELRHDFELGDKRLRLRIEILEKK